MWVCIHQYQQGYFVSSFREPLRHFQRHQATKGITDQDVRTLGTQVLQCVKIEPSHILNVLERFLHPVYSLSLNSIDGVPCTDLLCESGKLSGAAEAMCNENGRLLTTSLNLDKRRRPGGNNGPAQEGSEASDRRRLAQRTSWQLRTKDLCDLGKEQTRLLISAPEIKEALPGADRRPLQHALPDQREGFRCSGHELT